MSSQEQFEFKFSELPTERKQKLKNLLKQHKELLEKELEIIEKNIVKTIKDKIKAIDDVSHNKISFETFFHILDEKTRYLDMWFKKKGVRVYERKSNALRKQ
jgi:nicotinamide mononucleotide adenylyltransferase